MRRIELRQYPEGTFILQVKETWYELSKDEIKQMREVLCKEEG